MKDSKVCFAGQYLEIIDYSKANYEYSLTLNFILVLTDSKDESARNKLNGHLQIDESRLNWSNQK